MMSRVSLNLLPPEKKRALQTGFIMAYAQTMMLLFFVIAAFVAVMFLSVRLLLKSNYDGLTAQSSGAADEADGVATDIKQINAYIKRLESLQARFTPWSDVIARIGDTMPPGVVLETMSFAAKDGKIVMRGIADDRADVLQLRQNLLALPFLKNVSNPLSNLLQRKDVRFEFEMNYVSQ